MPALTLYVDTAFASPYAMSVYVSLIEKGLPFTVEAIDIDAGAHLLPPYRDLGLTGRVPTLVHGDFVLNESSAIIEYLDELFPETAVLPRAPRQRAVARQVQAWLRSDLLALRAERNTGVIFFAPIDTPLSEAGQAAAERLIRIASRLVTGPNLFAQWCITDLDLALMLNRLVMNGDPVPQPLKDYATAQWQRPSVQRWMAEPRG